MDKKKGKNQDTRERTTYLRVSKFGPIAVAVSLLKCCLRQFLRSKVLQWILFVKTQTRLFTEPARNFSLAFLPNHVISRHSHLYSVRCAALRSQPDSCLAILLWDTEGGKQAYDRARGNILEVRGIAKSTDRVGGHFVLTRAHC